MEKIIIRQTTQTEYAAIGDLIKTAFETAVHRDGNEQNFAAKLRTGENYIPRLDLTATLDGVPAGHIMLTQTGVTKPDGTRYDTLMVAPLSVLLEHRCAGIGSALMHEGLRIAAKMGYDSAFLLGDPAYYQRFGYRPAHLCGIVHDSFPAEYLLAKELVPGALDGITGKINM